MKKIIITVLVLVTVVVGGVWFSTNPFKIKDPNDPRFEIEKFQFQDYRGWKKVDAAMEEMFPVGTPKAEIDALFLGVMHMEESAPWYRREKTEEERKDGVGGSTIIDTGRGKDHYNIYYFLRNTGKDSRPGTGQYALARYTLDDMLEKPLHYGKVTLVKGQGTEVLIRVHSKEE